MVKKALVFLAEGAEGKIKKLNIYQKTRVIMENF